MKRLILIVFLFYVYKDIVLSQEISIYSPDKNGLNYSEIKDNLNKETKPITKMYLSLARDDVKNKQVDRPYSFNYDNNRNQNQSRQKQIIIQNNYSSRDCLDYSTEYYANKSRIVSLNQEIKYFENLKKNYSILNKEGSIQRSRIQGVINAKDYERFRVLRRNDYIDQKQANE